MRILDLYTLRKFIFVLIFALVAFVSIFVIVDLVERLSDYIDKKVPAGVVMSYYFYFVPYILVLMLPIAMLLASLFSVGNLGRYQELTAMKACGLAIHRILLPIFAFSLLLSLGMIAFAEYVVPEANQRKAEIKDQHIERLPKRLASRISNLYLQEHLDDQGHTLTNDGELSSAAGRSRRVFIGYYQSDAQRGNKVSIQEYDGVFITRRLDAAFIQWRKDHWIAVEGFEREFAGEREVAVPFDTLQLRQLSFTPEVLTKVQKDPEEMSYVELEQFIAEVRGNGGDPQRWYVDLYLKISFPVANFIIVLFGAPLAAGKVRSGGAVGVALTLVIAFLYFGTIKTGQTLGQNGTIDPMIGAWLGNAIFFVAGLWTLSRART